MSVYRKIIETIEKKGAAFFILLDPDNINFKNLPRFLDFCRSADVDGFLVGGSLMIKGDITNSIEEIKKHTDLPVVIFPGSVSQVTEKADAILFISLISGRNAEDLIGKHVLAAPIIKHKKIEPLATGYMLVESGKQTTAEYISGSKPIPRNKPEIAAATALAGEYLGMKLIYLEGGSGAEMSVPAEMISEVKNVCSLPIIVGGGIRDSRSAAEKVKAGASIIIIGNHFENEEHWHLITDFSHAIHYKIPTEV